MVDLSFVGTQPQWWDHLAPLANTVKAHGVFDYWRCFPPGDGPTREALRYAASKGPVVVASWVDAMTAYRAGARNIVLMEHGAGQCLAPGTPVLTAGLRHVPVESLSVGDELIGFAEDHHGTSARGRQHERTYVTATQQIMQPCHRLHFSDGTTVVASDGHRWLTRNRGTWGWVTTANLQDAARWPTRSSKLLRLTEVWEEDLSYGGGYLAAAFDGEGHISQHKKGSDRPGEYRLAVAFAQKRGLMLDKVERLLAERRFKFSVYENGAGVCHLVIKGGRPETLRFLGSIRPLRLLQNLKPLETGTIRGTEVQLLLSEPIGMQEVVGLETSSKTLVAAGLASHNSYSSRHRSYPGGQERNKLALVLAPNDQAAERHRKFYRNDPKAVVVGCPKLDVIHGLDPKPCGYPPVIAVSWHWDCRVSPEAGTAWSYNRTPLVGPAILDELVRMRDLGMIQLIGHAHPRIMDEIEPVYREREVTVVTFEEVMERADLYMIDNSSTLFEFAALDRPVIVVDSPRYRPRVRHGLRFWTHADIGVRISDPSEVARAVMVALEDPQEVADQRRRLVADVYPHIGTSRFVALDAIAARFRP